MSYDKYSDLPNETQKLLISNIIKNNTNFIKINSSQIEMLYNNQSLKSKSFIDCLKKFNDVSIEIEYPIDSFVPITDCVFKIKFLIGNIMKIGIIFVEFPTPIPKNCFSYFVSYTTIDSSINVIPCQAFRDCKYIKHFEIPSFIRSINEYAFSESKLEQISIPSSVKIIEKYAFSGCSSLKEITIPSSLTEIGEYAFHECSSLKKISIPSSVKIIGQGTFSKCKSLVNIEFMHPSSIQLIPFGFCIQCSKLKQIYIPDSVNEIGASAFQNCKSLTNVINPHSIKKIGNGAFDYCESLNSVGVPASCEIKSGLFTKFYKF